jgi:hypothetical protein
MFVFLWLIVLAIGEFRVKNEITSREVKNRPIYVVGERTGK